MRTHLAASVQIPFAELEAAMKQGKAVFKWKQIRLWMGSPLSQALSEHDDLNLELPLAVLTPLFLARLSSKGPTQKVAARPEFPDVFSARKEGESSEPQPVPAASPAVPAPQSFEQRITESFAAAVAPAKAPTAPPVAKPAASAPDPLTLARSNPLPAELVHKACQLSGVAGALVVTTDGLIIASQLPPGMNAETAAGFLPQIYGRLGQYTRELKLGDPSHVEMLVGNIPLQIYRGHSAYFAVLGKAAEPLPKLQLNSLASQLSHRTN
jgi:predicted regulator of Ras-like GTPase activity (Roadblock/LC7/MglB family)